jgi:predicted chitinase
VGDLMALVTLDQLRKIAPKGNARLLGALVEPLNEYMPKYGVTKPIRIAHFLAQAAHESDSFRAVVEYASGKAYEGRKDLGNIYPGDGVRFKGRGIFQCTGRANYEAYGRKLGLDLVKNPDMAAEPEVSVRIALEYWKAKGLNGWADRDDVIMITKRINGGRNGLADRQRYLAKAKAIFPEDDHPRPHAVPAAPVEEVPDAPIAAEPETSILKSKTAIGAGTIGAGEVVDGVSTATVVLEQVSSAKSTAESIGILDYAGALLTNPRFMFAMLVVVICVGIIWWRWQKKRDHGI